MPTPVVCVVRKLGRPGFHLSWYDPETESWSLHQLLTNDVREAQRAARQMRQELREAWTTEGSSIDKLAECALYLGQ